MASPKQLEYLQKYADDPRLTPGVRAQVKSLLAEPSKSAGNTLTLVFGLCPKEPKTASTHKAAANPERVYAKEFLPVVIEPGFYACPDAAGTLQFFKVTFGWQFAKDKPWLKDRVWVKRVVGGQPDQKCSPAEARKLLSMITNAFNDRQRYGFELKQCGKCNIHLTDPLSRERGYGSDCWTQVHG
jgi:Family of unknown function (DUF6011)